MRKDQLFSKVVELWKNDNEINNEIDFAFGVCFDVIASAAGANFNTCDPSFFTNLKTKCYHVYSPGRC